MHTQMHYAYKDAKFFHSFELHRLKTVFKSTMVIRQCVKRGKRVKKSSPSSSIWGELHSSMLEHIFQCLSFRDLLRVQSVSSHWLSVSKAVIASKLSHAQAQSSQAPWLMLPHVEEDENAERAIGGFLMSIDAEDKRVREIDNDMLVEAMAAKDGCCIGSSHGWLIFLDQKASPFLLNPSIPVKIQLPCLHSLLGILKIEKNTQLDGDYRIEYDFPKHSVSYTAHLRDNVVYKSVLTSNPCLGVNNLGVAVIYGPSRKLGYCKYGDGSRRDESSWIALDGDGGKFYPYDDIVCHKNKLYALGGNAGVEAWDLDGPVPIKTTEIKLCFPAKSIKMLNDFRYLYVCRPYLVENQGDWLLLVRFIGEFVNGNNEVVREEDLLLTEAAPGDTHTYSPPLFCPYKTLFFHVYKLDFDGKRWVEAESLGGGGAVFLGGSQSTWVSGYRENSIYFTDDYWERMEEDYLFGGHDMGFFSLEDGRLGSIYEDGSMKIRPQPCWVDPTPSPW